MVRMMKYEWYSETVARDSRSRIVVIGVVNLRACVVWLIILGNRTAVDESRSMNVESAEGKSKGVCPHFLAPSTLVRSPQMFGCCGLWAILFHDQHGNQHTTGILSIFDTSRDQYPLTTHHYCTGILRIVWCCVVVLVVTATLQVRQGDNWQYVLCRYSSVLFTGYWSRNRIAANPQQLKIWGDKLTIK